MLYQVSHLSRLSFAVMGAQDPGVQLALSAGNDAVAQYGVSTLTTHRAQAPVIPTSPNPPEDVVFGTVTFLHHPRKGAGPDSKVTWQITRLKDGTYQANRLAEFGALDQKVDPITENTPQKLIEKLEGLIPPDKKAHYSIELEDANGMKVNAFKELQGLKAQMCAIEKSNISLEEKQRKMQEMQWKMQLWQAIIELLKNLGKMTGIG